MVEASIGLTIFLTLLFGIVDFAFPMFLRVSLHHATRAGSRYAITGNTLNGLGHDASIKKIVKDNSFGILTDADMGKVEISYFDPSGASTAANDPGNMVVVAVKNYQVPRVAPINWAPGNWTITVSAADRLEPFTLPAPTR